MDHSIFNGPHPLRDALQSHRLAANDHSQDLQTYPHITPLPSDLLPISAHLSAEQIQSAMDESVRMNCCAHEVLLARGIVDETLYFQAFARFFGFRFKSDFKAGDLVGPKGQPLDSHALKAGVFRTANGDIFYFRKGEALQTLLHYHLSMNAHERHAIVLVPYQKMLQAVTSLSPAFLAEVSDKVEHLYHRQPMGSARHWWEHSTRLKRFALVFGTFALCLYASVTSNLFLLLLAVVSWCPLLFRVWVLAVDSFGERLMPVHVQQPARKEAQEPLQDRAQGYARPQEPSGGPAQVSAPLLTDEALPDYTLIVPLYRETSVIDQLLGSLNDIDYPPTRLEIILAVEADDTALIRALGQRRLADRYRVLQVPPVGPRTKPKALMASLLIARGEIVGIYDAEDIPHPGQLRQAASIFAQSSMDTGCLQFPLQIGNGDHNWLTAHFAADYCLHFSYCLPYFSARRWPICLGGTSNHFRSQMLHNIHGWDSYNVTEDADLGIRMYRRGYSCAMQALPTIEEAPTGLLAWVRQRTRWYKGWLITSLVCLQSPRQFLGEVGWRGIWGICLSVWFSLLGAAVQVFVLAGLVSLLVQYLISGSQDNLDSLSRFVLLQGLGYLIYALVNARAMLIRTIPYRLSSNLLLPVYWLMLSFALYRALWQLIFTPFHWEKTDHKGLACSETTSHDA